MKMSVIEPEIKAIHHVPIETIVWRVPLPDIYLAWEVVVHTCPQYEEIKLHKYVGEKFRYGYGQKSKILVIGDGV